MIKKVVLPILLLVLLLTAWFWVALHWSYSSGERAGWVQKLSHRGWLCKTWEGELALVSLPGTTPEKFPFTIYDNAVAARVTAVMGKRVNLHYEEKVGLPGSCFGETRQYVTGVTVSEEIPLAPGVMVPTVPVQPASSASSASR